MTYGSPSSTSPRAPVRSSHALSRAELPMLRAIHEADEDRGGLSRDELSADEAETCGGLVARGLAEVLGEYGEAPDGEEDERDAGSSCCYRVTGRGVEALAEAREAGL